VPSKIEIHDDDDVVIAGSHRALGEISNKAHRCSHFFIKQEAFRSLSSPWCLPVNER
jgi:hypothetical protein